VADSSIANPPASPLKSRFLMKLRNQLLALFCLLAFVAFGVFYVRLWVVQKPFGIILFVSDGMIVRHLTAARLYEGGADHHLAIESFPHVALVSNYARDFAVPDAAAATTALATGVKVNHRNVGTDYEGHSLRNILELAREQGRAVGIVTTGELTAASSAAFYSHVADARDVDEIALQLTQAKLDVVLGGGSTDFQPETNGGRRKDGRDLLKEIADQGREMVWTKADLENAAAFRTNGLVGIFAPGPLAFSDEIESGSQQPSLSDMVRRAIEFLEVNRNGYVLVVDAALVSHAADGNSGERAINETVALDHAILTATKYAGDKSLLIAVGKHAIGGLSLNGFPTRQDHGVALLGTNASGYPSLTWATGPNGPTENSLPQSKIEPAAFHMPSALNTAEDVIAIAQGDGAQKLHGFIDNTFIFQLLRDAL
jgi:alkaline phosphatase